MFQLLMNDAWSSIQYGSLYACSCAYFSILTLLMALKNALCRTS